MRSEMRRVAIAILVVLGLVGVMPRQAAAKSQQYTTPSEVNLQQRVRHALLTLPFYSVFDNLEFRVNGTAVELLGQVRLPVMKSDAEGAVKHVEGVSQVINHIEVLPTSNMDDQIRVAEYRAIYHSPELSQYALRAVPTVHIIVKNGHVTLTGVVGNQMDKTIAGMRANQVPFVFSVKNELLIG